MIKKTFYLPEQAMEKLRKEAEQKGVSMSEVLRAIIEKHFSERK